MLEFQGVAYGDDFKYYDNVYGMGTPISLWVFA